MTNKIFGVEMILTTLLKTFLEIFYKILLNFQVIVRGNKITDGNFMRNFLEF